MSTSAIVGRSSGTVIAVICCQGPAPSMAAASYTSSEISWMAAVYRMKLKPKVHHKVSSTTANQAPDVVPKKSGAVRPIQPNAFVINPVSGVYMKAKIKQTAEEGTTYGAKNASRKNHWFRAI